MVREKSKSSKFNIFRISVSDIIATTTNDSDSAISEGEPDSNDEHGPNIKLMLWHVKQRKIGSNINFLDEIGF